VFRPVNGLYDADSATPQKWAAETDSATYLLLFLSFFFWICFFGFFSPSLKLTKMKKQNKKWAEKSKATYLLLFLSFFFGMTSSQQLRGAFTITVQEER
jgi:hypothetical protein